MSSRQSAETSRRAVAIDALCLAAITLASALPYLTKIGFYSDDWALLADFAAAKRHGDWSEMALLFAPRPVQGVYLILLFELFGHAPLAYHIVNTAVLASCAVLFYLALLRIRIDRLAAFATALTFLMLPQLTAVRVWYAGFQVPLSMAFMLLSVHAQLSFARSGSPKWLAGAGIAGLLSIGAYEIFAPLIAGFAIALAIYARRRTGSKARRAHWPSVVMATVVAAVLVAVLYKIIVTGRAESVANPHRYLLGLQKLVQLDYDWRVDYGLNVFAAAQAYFWWPVRGWATGASDLLSGRSGVLVAAIAVATATMAWWRLRQGSQERGGVPIRQLLPVGLAVIVLGHATFLIAPAIAFTPTGVDTRMQVAAALGAAMLLVWAIGTCSNLLPARWRSSAFALAVALASATGFARVASIESYWSDVPALQQRVLTAARSDLQRLPAGSTVIVDGVCPYHGPAIVFENLWDMSGALTVALGREMKGDVVSPRMSITPGGLKTHIYDERSFYPYGPDLYLYRPAEHRVVRVSSSADAQRYFGSRTPVRCPVGYVGRGVEV